MLDHMYSRIIVKIGSAVIADHGRLNRKVCEELVNEIAILRAKGVEVVLVTSGAVASGKGVLVLSEHVDDIVQKQVFAAVGQVALMSLYTELFAAHGFTCAQVLATKEDFRDRQHYFNMQNCIQNLLQDNVIPVVNENDVVAIRELIFTDNDELAGLIASQVDADAVVILSSVEGVLAGDPSDPNTPVIPTIDCESDNYSTYINDTKSTGGRGGMHTKFGVAKKLARQGITTHIAHGARKNVLTDILAGKEVGTTFMPQKKLSSVKRRIAHSLHTARGSISVNTCTEDLLRARTVISLLPVGITKIEGGFEKGDVVEIVTENGSRLGYGIAQYDAVTATTLCGKKNERALIHYDYLYIE